MAIAIASAAAAPSAAAMPTTLTEVRIVGLREPALGPVGA
jgi:hypothetical protein